MARGVINKDSGLSDSQVHAAEGVANASCCNEPVR